MRYKNYVPKKRVQIYLEDDLLKPFEEKAKREDRSLNSVFREFIGTHIDLLEPDKDK